MQNNFILNQEYSKSNFFFETGHGSYIYSKKKKFLDLGYCAGTLLLGHNHKVLRESFKLLSNVAILYSLCRIIPISIRIWYYFCPSITWIWSCSGPSIAWIWSR